MKGTLFQFRLSHALILQARLNTQSLEELDWGTHDIRVQDHNKLGTGPQRNDFNTRLLKIAQSKI